MKTTIIFDLDGLLIDSERISYQIYHDSLETYHHEFSMETYIHDYSGKTAVMNMQNLIQNYALPFSLEDGLKEVAHKEETLIQKGIPLKCGVNEILYYYDYLNDIKQKPLTLRLMKFIGAYELFYNEEPKFYLDSCKIKMYKMLHTLRDCGLLTDVMDADCNISDALNDILYTYIDFNICDKVFDKDTKNKIASLGNETRKNNSIRLSRKI